MGYASSTHAKREMSCRADFSTVELAVADDEDLNWNQVAFAKLALPPKQKEIVLALTEAHVSRDAEGTHEVGRV